MMSATITSRAEVDEHFVLGETLRPLLTHAMGSSIEVFDTTGPADAGPPPHQHPWEEIYVVISGELQVTVAGAAPVVLGPGSAAHVPANTVHSYRNVTECHFLTITSHGRAAEFFAEVATVEMNPPDLPGIIGVANSHGIAFAL
ncbi:MAG: cupin domain-containing protein [Sporichthyaceae bacterium]